MGGAKARFACPIRLDGGACGRIACGLVSGAREGLRARRRALCSNLGAAMISLEQALIEVQEHFYRETGERLVGVTLNEDAFARLIRDLGASERYSSILSASAPRLGDMEIT